MPTSTRQTHAGSVLRNRRTWILISLSLLIVGAIVQRVLSVPSPAVVLSSTSWTPIGPAPAFSGSFTFSGRVDVAASDPSNSSVMYVGANNGGIWKTTDWLDSNPTWTEITNLPQILSLAVHEHDLVVFNSNIILAA